ncbi:hypothetical protein PA598K_00820 [Paenibacillus sp. 598K]|uniref:M56 family metallopeptidase n=1 Tax=Paenibacillus sp. 598K TaxID=1117987 RepID=UPI000FF9A8E9|nr:M56 family metallopeptidase [Paenibacillus sp. 598K]GBF72563.1 hypothetical protein PA598K_00820 [Paenibacillus sp. 598K]
MIKWLLMTSLAGSIASLFLILFKSKLAVLCGGRRYYYVCLSMLLLFLVPLSIDMPPLYSYPSLIQGTGSASLDASPTAAGERTAPGPSSSVASVSQAAGAVQAPARTAEAWIVGIWGSGAVVMLSFYFFNYFRFKRRALRGIRIDQADGLHVLASHDVHAPMLIGFHKPQVVFPMKHMSMEDYQLALKHELIHYKQKDAWFKLAAVIVNCLHWFNPVSYMALANISEACEYAVDEKLSKSMKGVEKKRYSEMILRFASPTSPAFNSGLTQPKKQLYRRFKLIMSRNTGRNQAFVGIAAVVLIVAVALLSTSVVFAKSSPTHTEYSGGIKTYYNTAQTLEQNVQSTLGHSALRVVAADLYIDEQGLKLDYFNRTAPYYKVGMQWMDKADSAVAAMTQIELSIQNRKVTVAFGEQAAAYKDDSVIKKMIANQMDYELKLDDKKLTYDHAAFVDELIRRGAYVIHEVLPPEQFTFLLTPLQNGDRAGHKQLTDYDKKNKLTHVFSGNAKLPKSELDPMADGSKGVQLGKAFVLKAGETLAMDVKATTDNSPTISLAVIDEATGRVVYWSPVVTSGTRTIFVPGESSANRSFKIVASGEQKDSAKLDIFTYPSRDEAHIQPPTKLNPGSLDSEPIQFKMG